MADSMPPLTPEQKAWMSQAVKAGLAKAKAQGQTLGRPTALSPDVVKRIHRMRQHGDSYHTIAARLNEDDVPTSQSGGVTPSSGGPQWSASAVRQVYIKRK